MYRLTRAMESLPRYNPNMAVKCLVSTLTFFSVAILLWRPATAAYVRSRNGVRITLGSGPRGRLEVSTTGTWGMPGYENKTLWFPVCAEVFTDATAATMCQLLGYKDGRRYASASVTNSSVKGIFSATKLSCSDSPYWRRRRGLMMSRHHEGDPASTTDGDSASKLANDGESIELYGNRHSHQSRQRVLSYTSFAVDIPDEIGLHCSFILGGCLPRGPFAGIQCSNSSMPPLPPSPPSPPSPFPYQDYVQVIGGFTAKDTVESNLCPLDPAFCKTYGRLMMKVAAPGGGGQVWAPVCAVKSYALRDKIAWVACQQANNWPSLMRFRPSIVTSHVPASGDLIVPRGAAINATAGDFNPAAYSAWVTILDLPGNQTRMLQEGNLTVSSKPCVNLFALYCIVLNARR
ncbi:hypothetical protein VOLCADRAFT_106062 [Volvox carteri f. nagariensis]|uniref:SRCR domain-containing protein n=1 Tax=Volvox carteri f. nagariensis TaxID=3068 RepID=D8U4U0_VOLCA|nr:uncharacterized protein VOLCADRAFT_106062 [Volvox carteri f. nagariensis]EFJ45246.1 hypothetical protein VOLCADRAFT_106062 [Volvox carteri f. nagariensis]|eukprot:XP_002953622.1 hypothetical protein VOLCADRAFT_106062 [Volvox carteri f. nagariensis]